MKIEEITADDLLRAEANARENLEAKNEFQLLKEQLDRAAPVRERLAFEFLTILEASLRGERLLKGWISYILRFADAISEPQRAEYERRLQEIIETAFKQLENLTEDRGRQLGLRLTFGCGMVSLKKANPKLFEEINRGFVGVLNPTEHRAQLLQEVMRGIETGRFHLSRVDN